MVVGWWWVGVRNLDSDTQSHEQQCGQEIEHSKGEERQVHMRRRTSIRRVVRVRRLQGNVRNSEASSEFCGGGLDVGRMVVEARGSLTTM